MRVSRLTMYKSQHFQGVSRKYGVSTDSVMPLLFLLLPLNRLTGLLD